VSKLRHDPRLEIAIPLRANVEAKTVTNRRRAIAIATMMLSLAVIVVVTLTPAQFSYRAHTVRVAFDLSATHLREDALNALLFAPLGVGAALARWSARRTLIATAATSLIIETLQWTVIPGRFAEAQDIVANSAGAMLAWFVARRLGVAKDN
jgi:VanZ family protein